MGRWVRSCCFPSLRTKIRPDGARGKDAWAMFRIALTLGCFLWLRDAQGHGGLWSSSSDRDSGIFQLVKTQNSGSLHSVKLGFPETPEKNLGTSTSTVIPCATGSGTSAPGLVGCDSGTSNLCALRNLLRSLNMQRCLIAQSFSHGSAAPWLRFLQRLVDELQE